MELLFLGTGAGVPAKQRNVSSIALQLLQERSAVWLFDCGEATQHQILHTSIRPRRIEKIFITHLHGDHIYGLPGLLGSRSFQGGEEPLTVYGPPGIEQFIKVTLEVSQTHLKYGLKVIEVNEGVIFEDSTFKVECAKLEHGVTSYGYRIVEKDLPGALQVERLKEAGVQPGPHYKQLKEGKRICLEDGREINGAEFIGESRPGKIVTILGDTRMCKNSTKLAENANVLVHEATFAEGDEKLAYDYYHSTAKQAAQVARQANVQKLILTHISARYQGQAVESLVEGALKEFKYTVVASDLASFPVE